MMARGQRSSTIARFGVAVAAFVSSCAAVTTFERGSPCDGFRGDGKKALVTGITGMLGSHLAEALVELGYEVHGFVRPRSALRNIASIRANISLITGELTDAWRTLHTIQTLKPDRIFHFAAQALNGASFGDPEYTLDTNIKTTLNILEAVRQAGLQNHTKIIAAGSSTVYGASTDEVDGPIAESAPMKPVSPYGVSKAATELLGQQYVRTYGMHVIVPRFFIHLAARGIESLALHEFSRQIAMIERGMQPPVIKHGDITTRRDITDIKDSAPVVACLLDVAPAGLEVNIGSGTTYTIKELLEMLMSRSTVSPIRLEADRSRFRAFDEKIVVADNTRLRNLTGWIPKPDLPGLVSEVLQYWRHEVSYRMMAQEGYASVNSHDKAAEL